MRGTPWLGGRRGVVITSRSDRVPLLSRRHTPPEKQNGTSDRPTLPAPTTTPLSLPLCFAFPLHPSRHSHTISSTSTPNFSLPFSPLSVSRLSTRENALEKLVVAYRGFVRGFVVRVLTKKKKKGKSGERIGREKKRGARDRARTLPRIHFFQSSRSARDSIREINDRERRRSGRSCSRGESFLERPPGDQKARPLLREREREKERGTRRSCLDREVGEREGRTVRRMPVIYSDARFDSLIAGK